MKNSFKKRAGRAALAGATLLGLTAAGLAFAAPASAAAGTNMVTGPLGMVNSAASSYFVTADGRNIKYVATANLETELAAGSFATDWTYPTFGGVGTISRDGKCQVGDSGINRTPNTIATCDDTAIAQKWFGKNVNGKLVLSNRTSTGKEMWLYSSGSANQQVTTLNSGYNYDMSAGLDRAFAVVDAPTLESPLPESEITPETVFSGQAQQGTVVTVKDASGKALGTTTAAANGTWSLTLDTAPVNGTHTLKIVALGTDGKSVTLAEGDYTMTASDEARALLSPEAHTTITPDTVFSGTGHLGDTVKIKDADGNVVGQATVGADGTWSTTLDGLVGNGVTDLIVEVTGKDDQTEQLADNSYTAQGFDEPRAVTSPLPGATITPDTVFTGTGNIGDRIVIKDADGNTIGTAVVGGDGTWSAPIASLPGNGDTALTIEVTGKDDVTETLAEETYTAEGVDLERAVTSPGAGDVITPETVFTGTGNIGDTVKIKDKDGNVLGEATVGKDGTWSTTLNPAPENGDTNLIVEVTGTDNVTETIADETYTMEGSDEARAYTGPTSGATVTPDTVYTGTGVEGDVVKITSTDGTVLAQTTIGADGQWSLTLDPAPMNGSTGLTVTVGGQKVADVNVTMTGSDEPRALTSPEAGSPITPDTEFSGTGNIGDVVKIKDKDGNVLGEATVGNDGKWSTTLNPAPDNGNIDLVIEITGKDNKTEQLADNTYEMTDSTTKFEVLTPNLDEVGGALKDETKFTGKGEPGTTVVITDKDGKPVGQTTVDDNGDWSTPITGLPEGPNNLEITYTVPGKDAVTIDLGAVTIVAGKAGDPVMDPSIAGGIGMVLLAAAGAYTGLRRRRVTA